MDLERRILVDKLLPALSLEYLKKQGVKIDWVDLRWGVSRKDSLNHTTMEACLGLLRYCKKINPYAFMIALLGQRYGWIPLPEQLDESLRSIMKISGKGALFDKVYRLDENNLSNEFYYAPWKFWHKKGSRYLSPVWTMKALDDIDGGSATIDKAFEEFNFLADTLWENSRARRFIGDNEIKKLFSSATEKELIEGFLTDGKYPDSGVVYIRNFTNIPGEFEDVFNPADGKERQQQLLEKVSQVVNNDNVVRFDVDFSGYNTSLWEEPFIQHMEKRLRNVIDNAIKKHKGKAQESDEASFTVENNDVLGSLKTYLNDNKRGLTKAQWRSVEMLLSRMDKSPLYLDLLARYLSGVSSWESVAELPLSTTGMVDLIINRIVRKINFPEYIVRCFVTAISVSFEVSADFLTDFFEIEPHIVKIISRWNVNDSNGYVPFTMLIRMAYELRCLVCESEDSFTTVFKFRKDGFRDCVAALSKTWPSPVAGQSLYEYIADFGLS